MGSKVKKNGETNQRVSGQRREVVEQIISDMEKFQGNWAKPWCAAGVPVNAESKKAYRGGNRLHLMAIAAKRGYSDPRWVTFKQAEKLGWKLRKGEKSAIVEKWKQFTFSSEREDEATGETKVSCRSFLKCVGYWSVFNAEQFDGAPEYSDGLRKPTRGEADAMADGFISSSRCPVFEMAQDRAFYRPVTDSIHVPLREQFSDTEAFLRTLWHEMAHSTANSDSPAARELKGCFGSADYAFEELVAELSSVFTASAMGTDVGADENSSHYEEHLAYLQSWIKALSDDPDQLFKAAAIAERASDYLIENYESAKTCEKAA